MPIPRPDAEAAAPRRLLRDVVYDQLFEAIADGTLEFGERLNDDELVSWLGVSRTPVREAIAKLSEYGIVDIEANRYTRVIAPTVDDFADTTRTSNDVWALIARRAVPRLTAEQAGRFLDLADLRLARVTARDPTALDPLFDMIQVLLEAAESPMLTRLEATLGARTILLFRRISATEHYPWALAATITGLLKKGVETRDPEATAAGFVWDHQGLSPFFEQLRTSGIFSAPRAS